jgi:Protein of unknown function (DUF3237)
MFGLPYTLEHLFSYNATLHSPREVIGPVAEGLRVNAFMTGGKVDGPRLRGIVRPGSGADWLTIRTDGIAVLDVRGTIETHDGGLISTAYRGLSDFGPDGYARALKGEPVPDGTPIRTVPTFQTAHPDYVWLNRIQALGIGEIIRSRSEVRYDVYAVR